MVIRPVLVGLGTLCTPGASSGPTGPSHWGGRQFNNRTAERLWVISVVGCVIVQVELQPLWKGSIILVIP